MNVAVRLAEKDFSSLTEQMSRWLDRVLGPEYHRYRARGSWKPSLNFYEDDASYYLVADLAGIQADTIDLRVEGKQLVLRGERISPRPERSAAAGALRVHLMEIDHGPFLRTLELPQSAGADRIEACYRNGFLWVKIPKRG